MKRMDRDEFYRFPRVHTKRGEPSKWDKNLCTCVGKPVKIVVCDDFGHNKTMSNGYQDSGIVIKDLTLVWQDGRQVQACATCKTPTKTREYSHVAICDYCHSFHPIGQLDDCTCVFDFFNDEERQDPYFWGLHLCFGDAICDAHMKLHQMREWWDEGVDDEYTDGCYEDEFDHIDGLSPRWIIMNSSPDIEWTAADFQD